MPDVDLMDLIQLERPWLGGGEPEITTPANTGLNQNVRTQNAQTYQQTQYNQTAGNAGYQNGGYQNAGYQQNGWGQYGQNQNMYAQNVQTPHYQSGTPYVQQTMPGQLCRLADGRVVSMFTQNGQLYFVPYIEKSGYNISQVEGQNVAVYAPQRKMVELKKGETSGFSIKNYGKNSTTDVFAGVSSGMRVAQDIPITKTRLEKAWHEVMKMIPGDQHIILSALGTSKVDVIGESKIRVTTISHTTLGDLRDSFRLWFREQMILLLENGSLEIEYKGPEKGQEIKIMTNAEKLKTMMEKSEGLRKLVEGLKLELI